MTSYEFDIHGHLKNKSQWDNAFVIAMAKEENIALTQDHWDIIHFFRDFHDQYNLTPAMRILINYLRQKWPEEKANSLYTQTLFPKSIMLQASRLAGLPKPSRCL